MVDKAPSSPTDTFLSLLSHADELTNAGRRREARRLLAQFVEGKHVEDRYLPALAAIYLRVGKPESAVATMRDAVDRLGASSDLLNTFGLILASLGRERESREQFEQALELDESNTEVLRNLAFALHRAGEPSRAYGMLVRSYDAAPLSAELRLVCGTLLELDGRVAEAASCYREAIEVTAVEDQVRLAGERLLRLGDRGDDGMTFEDVIDALREGFEHDRTTAGGSSDGELR